MFDFVHKKEARISVSLYIVCVLTFLCLLHLIISRLFC